MRTFKCFVCFQPSTEFPQDFQAVITDFIRVFNKFHSHTDVTNLILCKSCWIYLMRIHQLDGNLSKETRDVKFALFSSKIQRAQRSSLLESGGHSTGCDNFVAQIVTMENFDSISLKVESHDVGSVSVGGCATNTSDNGSSTGSMSDSGSSAEKDRTEQASADTSDSESEPKLVRPKQLLSTYKNEWLPKNATLRLSSSLVKRVSETDFIYLDKYPFQGTQFGFQCGSCPQVSFFCFYKSSALWYNIIGHIRKWHMGDDKVRTKKNLQRCIEVAPNCFQYGKYSFEKVDGKYQCGECGSLLAAGQRKDDKKYIQKHIIQIHKDTSRTFVCEYCGVVYNNKNSLRVHKMAKHEEPNSQIPCSDCGKIFGSRLSASTHQKNVHRKICEFICEICGKNLYSKAILEDHIAFVHKGQKVECKDCGKMFASHTALYTHRYSHTGKKYTCDICGMEFTQHYSVTRHKKTAHSA